MTCLFVLPPALISCDRCGWFIMRPRYVSGDVISDELFPVTECPRCEGSGFTVNPYSDMGKIPEYDQFRWELFCQERRVEGGSYSDFVRFSVDGLRRMVAGHGTRWKNSDNWPLL
jgi:hypothetical protein